MRLHFIYFHLSYLICGLRRVKHLFICSIFNRKLSRSLMTAVSMPWGRGQFRELLVSRSHQSLLVTQLLITTVLLAVAHHYCNLLNQLFCVLFTSESSLFLVFLRDRGNKAYRKCGYRLVYGSYANVLKEACLLYKYG